LNDAKNLTIDETLIHGFSLIKIHLSWTVGALACVQELCGTAAPGCAEVEEP